MKIDLSPGEWAGVMNVLGDAASMLRRATPADVYEVEEARELAADYERIAGIIRGALADDGCPDAADENHDRYCGNCPPRT